MHLGRSLKRNRQEILRMKDDAREIQSEFVTAKGSVPINSSKKRKAEDEEDFSENTKKTKIAQMIMVSADSSSPSGLI
jgi:hypothetical protein